MNSVVESGHQYASTFAGSKLTPAVVNKIFNIIKFGFYVSNEYLEYLFILFH